MKGYKWLRLWCLLILAVIGVTLFGHEGCLDYRSLKEKLAALRSENEKLALENEALKKRIPLLQDSRYIEQLARKELGMVKKGEVVYRFLRDPDSGAQ